MYKALIALVVCCFIFAAGCSDAVSKLTDEEVLINVKMRVYDTAEGSIENKAYQYAILVISEKADNDTDKFIQLLRDDFLRKSEDELVTAFKYEMAKRW